MKIGRNDPCSCGSGKKFKKCCENKNLSKKLNATLISNASELTNVSATSAVSVNFFKSTAISNSNPVRLDKKDIKNKS